MGGSSGPGAVGGYGIASPLDTLEVAARKIYQITINGRSQNIAVGGNGFIVGANPAGSVK
jgi:hypothetical protein